MEFSQTLDLDGQEDRLQYLNSFLPVVGSLDLFNPTDNGSRPSSSDAPLWPHLLTQIPITFAKLPRYTYLGVFFIVLTFGTKASLPV